MQDANLYNLLKYYAKHWIFIVGLGSLGLVGGLIYNGFIQKPEYKSSATLIIIDNASNSSSQNSTVINNYLELFKSRKVLEPVIKDLKLDQNYDELVSSIGTSNASGTEVIKLSVSTENASKSKKILDVAIAKFKVEGKTIYKKDSIQVVDSASLPNKAYNVNSLIQLAISTSSAFILSIILLSISFDFMLSKQKNESESTDEVEDTKPADEPVQPDRKLIIHDYHEPSRNFNIPNRRA